MNGQTMLSKLWLPILGLILFLTAIICRPLIPIDETRYMSVAWEMSLHGSWFEPLTKNFEPYSHKPPLLFWLINAFWEIFGVSRWAGTLPAIFASILSVYLTGQLGKKLAGNNSTSPLFDTKRSMLLMASTFPFMIYGTLVMFDFLLCVFVLLGYIFTLRFAEKREFKDLLALGLCLGFGVLTKGPVAYLYVLPAYLLAPIWATGLERRKNWYISCLVAILISAVPVLFWLIPVLKASDNHFAFWLVWNQTAGRVTGNFTEAHVRPFYFYLPLLPAFILPWALFPSVWKSLRDIKSKFKTDSQIKFLACCFVPVFLAFSFISGKQPHYMVPLVPALMLYIATVLNHIPTKRLAQILLAVTLFFVGGQIAAKHVLLHKYDLTPVVEVIHQNPDTNFAYVSNYHAEFSFLARRTSHIDDIAQADLPKWFIKHPEGMAIVRYKDPAQIADYDLVLTMEYRGRHLGIVKQKSPTKIESTK